MSDSTLSSDFTKSNISEKGMKVYEKYTRILARQAPAASYEEEDSEPLVAPAPVASTSVNLLEQSDVLKATPTAPVIVDSDESDESVLEENNIIKRKIKEDSPDAALKGIQSGVLGVASVASASAIGSGFSGGAKRELQVSNDVLQDITPDSEVVEPVEHHLDESDEIAEIEPLQAISPVNYAAEEDKPSNDVTNAISVNLPDAPKENIVDSSSSGLVKGASDEVEAPLEGVEASVEPGFSDDYNPQISLPGSDKLKGLIERKNERDVNAQKDIGYAPKIKTLPISVKDANPPVASPKSVFGTPLEPSDATAKKDDSVKAPAEEKTDKAIDSVVEAGGDASKVDGTSEVEDDSSAGKTGKSIWSALFDNPLDKSDKDAAAEGKASDDVKPAATNLQDDNTDVVELVEPIAEPVPEASAENASLLAESEGGAPAIPEIKLPKIESSDSLEDDERVDFSVISQSLAKTSNVDVGESEIVEPLTKEPKVEVNIPEEEKPEAKVDAVTNYDEVKLPEREGEETPVIATPEPVLSPKEVGLSASNASANVKVNESKPLQPLTEHLAKTADQAAQTEKAPEATEAHTEMLKNSTLLRKTRPAAKVANNFSAEESATPIGSSSNDLTKGGHPPLIKPEKKTSSFAPVQRKRKKKKGGFSALLIIFLLLLIGVIVGGAVAFQDKFKSFLAPAENTEQVQPIINEGQQPLPATDTNAPEETTNNKNTDKSNDDSLELLPSFID